MKFCIIIAVFQVQIILNMKICIINEDFHVYCRWGKMAEGQESANRTNLLADEETSGSIPISEAVIQPDRGTVAVEPLIFNRDLTAIADVQLERVCQGDSRASGDHHGRSTLGSTEME